MTPQEFHRGTGMMTDAGGHASSLRALPSEPSELCAVVQGLLLHVHWAQRYGLRPPPERMREIHVRPVERMLDEILALDPAPPDRARPVERRMLGTCRDFTVLSCAVLKQHGVPARARCGFGAYFEPGRFVDHWVCERWDEAGARWVLTDAQLDPLQRAALQLPFDPLDVPRDQFLVAGRAWELCRAGRGDPDRFGIFDLHGLWFVAGNLVRDLAAQNRMELLPWDGWGLLETDFKEYGDKELALLDHAAALTQDPDPHFAELRALYQDDARLRVPQTITSFTPEGRLRVELPG
jgi:hypothetical protein